MAEPKHSSGAPLWGVSAEFDNETATLAALRLLRDRKLGRLDAFTPVRMPEAAEAIGLQDTAMFPFALAGTVIGAVLMFGMCTYATIWDYRFNIGGRPLFSWPSFIVPTASFAFLSGAIAVVAAAMVFSRLPRLNHPSFNIPGFTRATNDRFFVAVEARDDDFDADQVEAALAELAMQPRKVSRVPR